MNKTSLILIISNLAIAGGIVSVVLLKPASKQDALESNSAYKVEVKKLEYGDAAVQAVILGKNKMSDRKKRITSRYFIPSAGGRNAFTELVDGMVIEGMKRRLPLAATFEKYMKEELGDLSKEEKSRLRKEFKRIMTEYLQKVYLIQRGTEEGDLIELQHEMKGQLSSQLGLDNDGLSRLEEIEKAAKSSRQLKVFEKLLIRDQDKLTKEQSASLESILVSQQTTVFDSPESGDTAFKRSDKVLQEVNQTLNGDQAAHFRYFQEYHWHSYDFQEMNDMSNF
jgi:hypothetical protein